MLIAALCGANAECQTITNVVDQFNPAGSGGNVYSSGQIGNVWYYWWGGAFQSLTWDSTSDAQTNAASGSMKLELNFPGPGGDDQFAIYDGTGGINPALNAIQFTNFQCDVRFAAGSATENIGGTNTFGILQFGMPTPSYGQDYFGGQSFGIAIPATNTNWVHVSIPLNAFADTNLLAMAGVFIHLYSTVLSGPSTLWVDNIQFAGMATNTGTATVNYNDVRQRIDGFGGSSAWDNSVWSSGKADLFFSTNNGCGLSLLRTRIAPDGSTVEAGIAQQAQARGARVWSTPWSPPANYKTSGTVNGGSFISSPANMTNYARQLAGYVAMMKKNYGVNLYALSVQNEPDYSTTYESCLWTSQQIHDFVTNLSVAMAAGNVSSTLIMLPEDDNWEWDLATNSMNDPATSNLVGVLAAHNYGSSPAPVTQFGSQLSKPLWETEHYFGSDDSITNGLALAQEIHDFLTIANVNAYHYWWLNGSGNGSLAGNSISPPAKRLYVMGNYSLFARPGFYRIGVTNSTTALVTAFKDPLSSNFVVVAANPTAYPVNQTFTLVNFPVLGSLTQWVTSSSLSLSNQGTLGVTNGVVHYVLPAWTVVSLVYVQPVSPVSLSYGLSPGNVTLQWPSTGWILQSQTNAAGKGFGTNWADVPGSSNNTQSMVAISRTNPAVFYRLRHP
jgi:glucuronoarabinoxylan endo-1,4-beta-xylanase